MADAVVYWPPRMPPVVASFLEAGMSKNRKKRRHGAIVLDFDKMRFDSEDKAYAVEILVRSLVWTSQQDDSPDGACNCGICLALSALIEQVTADVSKRSTKVILDVLSYFPVGARRVERASIRNRGAASTEPSVN